MKHIVDIPIALICMSIISGCSSIPQNPSLAEAHSRFRDAQTNPDITNLAALELNDANESLRKGDVALSNGNNDDEVNQLAYISKQQVTIAEETAKRKTAELVVTNAGAKRAEIQLAARTSEVDAANEQIKLLEALNAKRTDRGMVITLGDVLFSTGMSDLASGGMRNVQKLAGYLIQYPQENVLIEGYTDNVGSDSSNQGLSDRRANAVRTALINMDINSSRITSRGYGEAFPVATNSDAASRQLNRRVEVVFSDIDGNISPR
jgi:outer membrane protein OmpA-like peptidoglycan-associated protein